METKAVLLSKIILHFGFIGVEYYTPQKSFQDKTCLGYKKCSTPDELVGQVSYFLNICNEPIESVCFFNSENEKFGYYFLDNLLDNQKNQNS